MLTPWSDIKVQSLGGKKALRCSRGKHSLTPKNCERLDGQQHKSPITNNTNISLLSHAVAEDHKPEVGGMSKTKQNNYTNSN